MAWVKKGDPGYEEFYAKARLWPSRINKYPKKGEPRYEEYRALANHSQKAWRKKKRAGAMKDSERSAAKKSEIDALDTSLRSGGSNLRGALRPPTKRQIRRAAEALKRAKRTKLPIQEHQQMPAAPLHPITPAQFISAEPPRTPSRDEKRRVYEAVEGVYPKAEGGYMPGASDESIAKKLGLPRAWITKTRDEFFGPASVVNLAKIEEEVQKARARVNAAEEATMTNLSKYADAVADFGRLLTAIRASVARAP
jgi:hypothetical protein